MNDFQQYVDPRGELAAWIRAQGLGEEDVRRAGTDFNFWLECVKARQMDPEVRAAQDARSDSWELKNAGYKRAERRDVLRRAEVPEGFWPIVLAPDSTEAIRIARVWLATSARWLVLSGGPGTGKSVAAAWALLERGTGKWLDIFEASRTGDGKRDRGDKALWVQAERAQLLVVDDFGSEDNETRERLCRMLISRDNFGRRTILTTNAHESLAKLDDRLQDRMRGAVRVIEGGSLR